jgi:thiol-disulfide isomerase/thioredoxin
MAKKRKRRSKDNFIRNVLIVFGSMLVILIGMLIIYNITSDELKYKDFENVSSYEEVKNISDQKYLLYFYSDSCPYCQQIKAASLNFFDENKDELPVYMLDADRIRGSKDSLNLPFGESLSSTPTLMVVENGIITQFLVGTVEIQNYYDNYGK